MKPKKSDSDKEQIKEEAKEELYMQVESLISSSKRSLIKSVNQTMVYTYFELGKMIVNFEQEGEKRAEYGKEVLKNLSEKLAKSFGKGFSVDNLENMRKFYVAYSKTNFPTKNSISENVSRKLNKRENEEENTTKILDSKSKSKSNFRPVFKLSWSHYLKLIRIEDQNERGFYEIEAIQNFWTLKELQRQVDSALYQRLALSRDKDQIKELSKKGQLISKPSDALKDPYILEFIGLPEQKNYSESDLEQELIDKLEHFLLELGKGFTFVARQKRISFDEKHFKIDLVFYNRLLKCFVLIDLKIGELKHQDIGQIQMYVNYYDRFIKLDEENKTIGIILCQDKNDTLVEITLPEDNEQIFASKYKTILPSKDELKKLIEDKE